MAIDGAQIEALYRQFGPAIYRRCLKLLRNAAEAEDATQEVFVRVCRHLGRFRYGPSELPWMYQIATRFCLNRLRDGARRDAAQPKLAGAPSLAADVGRALADRQVCGQLLARVDRKTGLIAMYALVDGMTQEEVAVALGFSRRTVGTRLQKFLDGAQKFLRRVA